MVAGGWQLSSVDTLRRRIEQSIEEDRMSLEESAALLKRFEAGLASYTYLITPDRVEAPTRVEPAVSR